ncbi:D-mannonate oxidoreductase [Arachidicoccus ginsenosidimutans]|uniref:SDR family oxidoreductase n=1 Tax=Arachidicoccus sp. BS20 TaxID=1850526 RepID=UPI0007F0BB95|nr:SDR family oxidoreductase [Arachidicoccus sp. BS20]ANI90585.1 D-mannonate oxidoreductase [Arachidicoccus sp. BS20]
MADFSLKNKVIIVTGGTGILGGSFVSAIAEAEGKVVIIGRNKERLNKKEEAVKSAGGEALSIQADVMEEAQLVEAREKILSVYGKIDGLVNAAGGNVPEGILQANDDIFSMNIAGMQKALSLNLWGSVIPTQIFGQAMKENGGSIVNISSVSSKTILTKVLGYSMGKAAIDTYTSWFAVEAARRYGDKIRMNSITPGFFLTEQNRTLLTNSDGSLTDRGNAIIANTPFNRFGKPEELNGALVWLLSDASKFVTASTVMVDGGFTVFSGV